MAYPLAEISLTSGVRYAPFGASVKLYGNRLVRLPLAATIGYQTNFGRNHALAARLELPPLWQRRVTISEALDYQYLQAVPAAIRFHSYSATLSIGGFRPMKALPKTTLLLGGGYAQYQPLDSDETARSTGYSFGLLNYYYPWPLFNLVSTVKATRWPDYWQWQARLTHPFGRDFQAGVVFDHLRRYTEVSVLVIHAFY
ncbi:hypothetical protein [Hymenobacter siberiensis]|uniref:hypothetical protein n=1 Tax=Hymenobacter siberiensis TaxID=2848396 RepID=UPI001C1DD9BD|nr:hypothetical protein [Hymenobacter siberiensis]MBU6122826.1 hypothetical protein [Hymenobacter siberiensis]